MKVIITSEMRVGSRWLHYLLKDLLQMKQSPELDVSQIPQCQKQVDNYFKTGRIVKFHHATLNDLNKLKGDFKVIGVVRNPRDRIVSWAFHQRYKPKGQGIKEIKEAKDDKEAVKKTLYLPMTNQHNADNLRLMIKDMSTKKYKPENKQSYIWTSYRWLINDLAGEVSTIARFLGANTTPFEIRTVCNKHKFKSRSGREVGDEQRNNEWFRKGVEGDSFNFFDYDMLLYSTIDNYGYWCKILDEEGKDLDHKKFNLQSF